jgi:fructokinase
MTPRGPGSHRTARPGACRRAKRPVILAGMILVAGESLIDLIADPAGGVRASLGGGPYNAARTLSRLGAPAQFLGRVSADPFGAQLAGGLAESGVHLGQRAPVAEPTTLAVLSVAGDGIARYWFHLTGTAGVILDTGSAAAALAGGRVTGLHTGALGLLAEPMASGIETLAGQLPDRALLLLDPNCRPSATADPDGYRARVQRLAARADIVKVSTDDLGFLRPGAGLADAAASMLSAGARCVLVTDGPAAVRIFTKDYGMTVPVPAARIVDTVGAGDAFGGGFLAWWTEHGLGRDSLADQGTVRAAAAAAAAVASLTCERLGADPPWRASLGPDQGWDPPPGAKPRPEYDSQ